jgi:hypothetical protein
MSHVRCLWVYRVTIIAAEPQALHFLTVWTVDTYGTVRVVEE